MQRVTNWRVVAGVFAAACLLLRLKRALTVAAFPYQLDYEEGNILNAAARLLHGQQVYPAPGSFPYIFSPYGPVGYWGAAGAVKLLGLSLWGPRLLVLLAGAGIALIMAWLIAKCGSDWRIGLLAGAVSLCTPLGRTWYPLLRVDYIAILLALTGMAVFAGNRRGWPAAAILFALAALTKITAITAPLACATELVLEKKHKQAIGFAAVSSVTWLGGMALTPGSPFFHVLRTHPDPYSLARYLGLLAGAIESSLLALIVIVYAVALEGFQPEGKGRLLWLYAGFASLLTFTAGKLGSETNHFLEWTASVWLLAALAVCELLAKSKVPGKIFAGAFAAMALTVPLLPSRYFLRERGLSGCGEAYAYVKTFRGERILSEDVTALVLAGKPVLVSNPYVQTVLGNSVKWQEGSLEEMARRQEFDLIVLGGEASRYDPAAERWPADFMRTIAEEYQPARAFSCAPMLGETYVPRK